MLLDLGVNMEHFKDMERGFSLHSDAPLDMRFSKTFPLTAKAVINTYPAQQLEKMLTTYGDFSPKTAQYLTKGIIEARKHHPLETTKQLKEVLYELHCNQKKIAVVFQTLRIETNKELQQLEIFLKNFGKQLIIGGRCVIITYHSIEDRMVKNAFKALAQKESEQLDGCFQLVNKKVILPQYTEVQHNKAARSAKLRVIERTA
jgi:16S rRNA (cytosine1402-N4)-methyltransferase